MGFCVPKFVAHPPCQRNIALPTHGKATHRFQPGKRIVRWAELLALLSMVGVVVRTTHRYHRGI